MNMEFMAFAFILLFGLMIAAAAIFFISYDVLPPEPQSLTEANSSSFAVIRRINSETIETVDSAGRVQHWQRSDHNTDAESTR